MIDIIIRDCGNGEWLPLIITSTGKELFLGSRVSGSSVGRELAFVQAKTAWDESTTGDIIEFKRKYGIS